MTVTRIPEAFIVTCGGTCGTPHGFHLVIRLNGKWICDGTCPSYTYRKACRHIDEVLGSRVPVPLAAARFGGSRAAYDALDDLDTWS